LGDPLPTFFEGEFDHGVIESAASQDVVDCFKGFVVLAVVFTTVNLSWSWTEINWEAVVVLQSGL